jgi:hypothetical protein
MAAGRYKATMDASALMRAKIATAITVFSSVVALSLVPAIAHARLALLTCGGSSASEGWSEFTIDGGDSVPTCSRSLTFDSTTYPPGMEANLTEGAREGTRAGLEFRAPSGETISGGDITLVPLGRGEGGEPGGPVASQLATDVLEDVFWEGVNNRINTVAIPAGGQDLFASVLCRSMPGGQRCYVETLFVLAATILLTPNSNPSVSALSGPLTTSGAQHGMQDVSFTATDPGGPGVYRVTASIDGKVVYQATPNLNGGACAPVGTYRSALEFYSLQPCPQSVPVNLPIETGTLPDGIHSLVVTATDAADDVSSASQIIFRSENLISTASAGRVARTGTGGERAYLVQFDGSTNSFLLDRVRRSYEDSALTLSGTLTTPQDAVAPDVPMHLFARDDGASGETMLASTTSDAAGHWSLTAPQGPSRTLRIGYGQASAANTPAGTAVKESVNPTLSLRIRDRTGGHLSFSGQVSIGPLDHPYPIVVIEASADGVHWQSVGNPVRTNSQGSFHLSYASAPSIGGRFAFRASTPEAVSWLRGATIKRWLRVR